uniref:Putative secreted protein n=1 Tax=Anopheles triannulatus TaxID=58253 RepID=A0A2M4B400_9DIPT
MSSVPVRSYRCRVPAVAALAPAAGGCTDGCAAAAGGAVARDCSGRRAKRRIVTLVRSAEATVGSSARTRGCSANRRKSRAVPEAHSHTVRVGR